MSYSLTLQVTRRHPKVFVCLCNWIFLFMSWLVKSSSYSPLLRRECQYCSLKLHLTIVINYVEAACCLCINVLVLPPLALHAKKHITVLSLLYFVVLSIWCATMYCCRYFLCCLQQCGRMAVVICGANAYSTSRALFCKYLVYPEFALIAYSWLMLKQSGTLMALP